MPVFPTYEARIQGLDTDRAARIDIGADAIAQGVRNMGQGVQSMGAQINAGYEAYKEKQEKQAKFDQGVSLDQTFAQISTKQQELERNIPANGAGYRDSVMSVYDASTQGWLKKLPTEQQKHWSGDIDTRREKLFAAATAYETQQRGKYEAGTLQESLNRSMNAIVGDPAQTDAAIAQFDQGIDLTTSLTPAQKEDMKKAARQGLTSAEWRERYKNDPAGGLAAFGFQWSGGHDSAGGSGLRSPAAGKAPTGPAISQIRQGAVSLGKEMNLDPADILTVISYETGGTMDPWKAGPTTQWGQHRGLIQWGEPQRKKYGITKDMSPADQMVAVGKYLKDHGVKPGDTILQIYAAINAGDARKIHASDANNGGAPGTVLDKVRGQMAGHRKRAQAILGGQGGAGFSIVSTEAAAPGDGGAGQLVRVGAGDPRYADLPYEMRLKMADQAERDWKQRQTQAATEQKAAIATAQNNLQNLLIDGKAGMSDIEAARQQGWLSDADTVTKFRNIVEDRNKKMEDANLFVAAMGQGQKLNPYDAKVQNGADQVFKSLGGGIDALETVYKGSGVVPKAAGQQIMAAATGTDISAGQAALQTAANILADNPNAFRATPNGAEIAQGAVAYNHYLGLGMSAEAAAKRVMQENDPAYKAKVAVDDKAVNDFTKTLTQGEILGLYRNTPWLPFTGVADMRPEQSAAVMGDFREVAVERFRETGDADLAKAQAKAQLDAVYGSTSFFGANTLMKYPPEKAYPPIGGSYDYIKAQAVEAVKEATGKDIPPEDVSLVMIGPEGIAGGNGNATQRAFLAGDQPVPYRLAYMDTRGGQKFLEYIDRPFIADPKAGQIAESAAREKVLDADADWTRDAALNQREMEASMGLPQRPRGRDAAPAAEPTYGVGGLSGAPMDPGSGGLSGAPMDPGGGGVGGPARLQVEVKGLDAPPPPAPPKMGKDAKARQREAVQKWARGDRDKAEFDELQARGWNIEGVR